MRAARFHEYGSAEVMRVEDAPDPRPGPGEVVVRVRACSLNHVDIDIREGVSRLPITLPHILGLEIAGDVVELGGGVEGVAVADRVSPLYQVHCRECDWCALGEHMHCRNVQMFGITRPGGFAEHVAAPAYALIPLPDSLSYEEAVATQTSFATCWHALTKRARVREGDWVLVNAAGSGVGSSGIQLVRLLGGRVIASAGSDEKLDPARELGAEATVNYKTENLAERVRDLTGGRGVDVVLESVGGEILSQSIDALATLGKLVLVGCHAGEVVPVDFIQLFRNQLTLYGSARATAEELSHMITLAADGRIRPIVSQTFALEEIQDAQRLMESRSQFGKIVVRP